MPPYVIARCFLIMILVGALSSSVMAEDLRRFSDGGDMIYGGNPDLGKAAGDTINLMAAHGDPTNGPGEPTYFGDFQSGGGAPNWNDWTHYDITQPTTSHWTVSTYNQADPGNHAAWCGEIYYAACDTNDVDGGYGNVWYDLLEFRVAVPNPGLNSTVSVTATLQHDSEPGYDFTYLSYLFEDQVFGNMGSWDAQGTVAVNDSITYSPLEYLDGTDIAVYFRFRSDGGWSDEDCIFPSAGACQVDDINVHLVNGGFTADYFEDFEHGGVADDFGLWNIAFPVGVGDFAKIWSGLRDLDPCVTNTTPQAAFIDDGVVVPGTGGSQCINWCYGPAGYIVNTLGGLAGPSEHIKNAIESPVMSWPAPKSGTGSDYEGALLAFSVYRHEDLTADAPGIAYLWGVRTADTDNSAGNGIQFIGEQPWMDRNFLYMGGPEYHRQVEMVTDLLNPGCDEVQIQLTVWEFGFRHGWVGNDGYPAPYFDNVTLKVFPNIGPAMAAREFDLAQDNFPDKGSIDPANPGTHSVRFDMARNISHAVHMRNDPGDSIVVDISPARSGSEFVDDPALHYIVDRNPVFDPYRTSGLPAAGSVAGRPAVFYGNINEDKWAFDLPDTGFLFPGDVLRYYISATDAIGGTGGTDPRTALMPADTTGFSSASWGDPQSYDSSFTVRALPTLKNDGVGGFEQPSILFLNDFANRGGQDEWYTALANTGLSISEDYDVYYVNSPFTGVGNGIGGRANSALLANYDIILYTSGDLVRITISNGDYNQDAGDDVGTLTGWMDQGGKDLFLTGDGIAGDLGQSGSATWNFLNNYLGLSFQSSDIRGLIGNQTSPLVAATPANPVFNGSLQGWIAYGGCVDINTFDAVNAGPSTIRLAEFRDPAGNISAYSYSAATLAHSVGLLGTSQAISLPYDLMNIYTDPDSPGGSIAARTALLQDCLVYFGLGVGWQPTPVLSGISFRTSNHPNPFNPSTTIKYSMPRAGHLSLKVYNVRGQLVRTLIDGPRPEGADQTAVWDGNDNRGSGVSSGVYFYEARVDTDVKIGKMTLLK